MDQVDKLVILSALISLISGEYSISLLKIPLILLMYKFKEI